MSGLKMWLPFSSSQQLGEELVVNGDFANGTTGWSFSSEWSVNSLNQATRVGAGKTPILQDGVLVDGFNQLTFTLVSGEVSVYTQYPSFGARQSFTTPGTYTIILETDSSVANYDKLYFYNKDAGDVCTIDNISVKEVGQFSLDETINNNDAKLLTGNCLDFDGLNDYLDVDGFTMSGTNATFAFWINPDATSGFILDSTETTTSNVNRLVLGFLSNKISIFSTNAWDSFETINTGVWSRVVITISGTTAKCFVNGVQLGSNVTIVAIDLSSSTLVKIGSRYSGTQDYINGSLSDFQIWNAVWSATDIANDYAKPNEVVSSVPTVNLVGYWAMTEGNGGIAYDSSSLLSAEKVSNGTFELGSEEVTNGNFATDSNWSLTSAGDSSSNVIITNNTCQIISDGTLTGLTQTSVTTSGKTYKVVIDIQSITNQGGGIAITNGNVFASSVATFNTVGLKTFYFTASSTSLSIKRASGLGGNIDYVINSISVKEVTDWTLAAGWSVANGKANANTSGNYKNLTQSNIFEVGKTYTTSFEITAISQGSVRLSQAGIDVSGFKSSLGVYTTNYTAISTGSSDQLIMQGFNSFIGTIGNISIKQVTPADNGAITNGATWLPAQSTIPQLGMMDWSKGSNLITYSEDFSQWSKLNGGTGSLPILTSNNSISPNGTQNADKIVFNKGNATSNSDYSLIRLDYGGSDINGTSSVYLKSDVNINIEISSDDISYKTILVTTNWNRFEVSDATSDRLSMGLRGTEPSNSSATIYAWAAQLEVGTSAGNYRKTNGTAVTNAILPPYPVNPTTDVLGNLLRQRLNSLNLTGSGYSSVANSSTLQFGTDAFTIQAWIKPFSLVANNRILTKGVTGNGQFMISVASDASVRVFAKDSSGNSLDTTNVFSTLTINSWQMITVIIDTPNDQILFYKNDGNVETKTGASWTGNFNSTQPITIGNTSSVSAGQFFDGLVSDALVYDRALLATEVEQNYKAGLSTHLSLAELNADAFQLRVVADGGVFESYACLKDQLTTLNDI